MILTWNVRGLNKRIRHLEIRAHLKNLHVPCIALLETKVKQNNTHKIRHQFGQDWSWLDNYEKHTHGIIWVIWKHKEIHVHAYSCGDQYLHRKLQDMNGNRFCWTTFV